LSCQLIVSDFSIAYSGHCLRLPVAWVTTTEKFHCSIIPSQDWTAQYIQLACATLPLLTNSV